MALLAVQDAREGLTNITMTACNAGGDTVPAGTKHATGALPVFLLVLNTDVATKTVTVAGQSYAPVEVPITTGRSILPVHAIANGSIIAITYSAVTNLTIAAISL